MFRYLNMSVTPGSGVRKQDGAKCIGEFKQRFYIVDFKVTLSYQMIDFFEAIFISFTLSR